MFIKATILGIKIVLAVQIFNWMITEVNLVLPGFKTAAVQTLENFAFPTHQELLQNGLPSFSELGEKVDGFFTESELPQLVSNLGSKETSISTDSQSILEKLKRDLSSKPTIITR